MRTIGIIIIILLIYYLFFSEGFITKSPYSYVRLWRLGSSSIYPSKSPAPWAVYSSADGKFLNHTFRHDISRIDYDFTCGDVYMELWGYRGSGDPKVENQGNLYMNANWDLVTLYNKGRGHINLGTFDSSIINGDYENNAVHSLQTLPEMAIIPQRGSIIPSYNYHAYRIVLIFD